MLSNSGGDTILPVIATRNGPRKLPSLISMASALLRKATSSEGTSKQPKLADQADTCLQYIHALCRSELLADQLRGIWIGDLVGADKGPVHERRRFGKQLDALLHQRRQGQSGVDRARRSASSMPRPAPDTAPAASAKACRRHLANVDAVQPVQLG